MSEVSLSTHSHLDTAEVRDLEVLLTAATEFDGVRPLSEHVWLHVNHGGDEQAVHVLARTNDGRLVGYAHLDTTDEVDGPSAELVVHPDFRQRGIGRHLVTSLLDRTDRRLRLWAHGEHVAATKLADALGFERHRTLWQMRRSLHASLPEARFPTGIRVAPFAVGKDEHDVLALNAAAFAHLPDQGSWTQEDLVRREREAWFDPAGVLLAWDDDDQLAGFHWTKVHGGDHAMGPVDHARLHAEGIHHAHDHGHEELGEVYVIGVAPDWQGTGLGRALLVAGLRHLASRGLPQAMLYVDASNTAAIGLYASLGFTHWDTDVLYRRA